MTMDRRCRIHIMPGVFRHLVSGLLLYATALSFLGIARTTFAQPRADEPSRPDASRAESAELPSLYSLQQEIRAVVHREATATTLVEREAAIRAMAELYRRLLSDPRYPTHDVLRRGRARLWGRLTLIQRDLERTNKRLERQLKAAPSGDRVRVAESDAVTHVLIAHYDLVGSTLGGPGKLFASGQEPPAGEPRGGAAQLDHGRLLVELIERTIMPGSWDVNGGPGTIVYYAPLHALVVSATEEVHEKIGGILGSVRE